MNDKLETKREADLRRGHSFHSQLTVGEVIARRFYEGSAAEKFFLGLKQRRPYDSHELFGLTEEVDQVDLPHSNGVVYLKDSAITFQYYGREKELEVYDVKSPKGIDGMARVNEFLDLVSIIGETIDTKEVYPGW